MDNWMERRYPIGIQTFSRIIEEGYVYVDKTDIIWKMAQVSPYVFLSRPRRFGKSLLSSTLHSFFAGERDLFEGLKVMELEKEWKTYPILHIDLSMAKNTTSATELRQAILRLLKPYGKVYGIEGQDMPPGGFLSELIHQAYEQTGRQVVIIIDEYDAPLLDVMHTKDRLDDYRIIMQEFYQPLKANEAIIRFCFLTGITKMSQLSIFSTLNNITNVSLLPEFATICGITETELTHVLATDIARLAAANKITDEEMQAKLAMKYDGYHFAGDAEGVYNPFSLMNAFATKRLGNYWFETGTPTFLIKQLQLFHSDITNMDDIEAPAISFDRPTEAMTSVLPLLYQAGYLTIKDYDPESDIYTLSIPNGEVRVGYVDGLLPTYAGLEGGDVQIGFALKFWRALKKDDLDLALREMQTYLASIPYVEGFKKKLAEAATAEGFYEYTLYLIFSMLNVYVRTQVKCRGGRIDMVVKMPNTTYVFELKTNGTAAEALAQIDARDYALPYQTEGHKVVKAGILFNLQTRTVENWAIV